MGNRTYRIVNNCDGRGEEVGGGGDSNANRDTSYYKWGRPLGQVNYMEGSSSSIALELCDIENWKADREIGNYLVNRSVANEYLDSGRSGVATFPKRSAKRTW